MKHYLKQTHIVLMTGMIALALGLPAPSAAGPKPNPCNPCGPKMKNPCNPCGPKMKNPCEGGTKVDPKRVTRPAGTKLMAGKSADLVKEGKRLWNDKALSTNGLACQTCHQGNAAFKPSFAKPYPHKVAMAKTEAGLKQVNLDEMIQLCLVVPMAAKPLPWDSKELAALTAYTGEVQKNFKPIAVNPCAPKKMKNPCNPCAPKVKNPCNPCGTGK